MKIRIAFIILLTLTISCNDSYTEITEKFNNGSPKEIKIYPDKNEKSEFQYIIYFQNGNKEFIGNIKNNKFIGTKIIYYDNGNLKEIDSLLKPCDLNLCCCDGTVSLFDSSGRIMETYENRNGLENGLVKIYKKKSGKIDQILEYVDGKRNGIYKCYFDNGQIEIMGQFKNDTNISYTYFFNENGDTIKYFNHLNGEKTFPFKKWLDNGLIFYADFIDRKKNKILYQWVDKKGNEVKRELKEAKNSDYVMPD